MSANTDPEGRALAVTMFPVEWALAEAMTGKARHRRMASLRNRAKTQVAISALVGAGRSCATCDNYVDGPHGMGKVCDAASGGGAYVRAKPDEICTDWRAKTNPLPLRSREGS